ncbi:MAG: PAS domain S-box protein [Hydrogenophaga sp.]|uniref:sensor histidine kinase n=1 Tax=Hydrogenophaga sp. TaxID=1904254 RepID=UPI001D92CAD3|nr:PAS domain S-box protein [Hydrogenophaga sp.]MBX3611784.1 PAS domain S-box protein [Hydrogenophaga sp.]
MIRISSSPNAYRRGAMNRIAYAAEATGSGAIGDIDMNGQALPKALTLVPASDDATTPEADIEASPPSEAGLDDLGDWLQVLRRIVEHSDNMVVITDRDQRIRWVNSTYGAVTGWSLKEVQGRRASEFLHGPLTSTRVTARLKSDLSAGRAISGIELINYRKDGQAYTVLLNIEPIRDAAGEVAAYFSIQTDISERKVLEQANLRLQHHLEVAQQLAQLGRIEYDHQLGRSRWSSEVFRIADRPISNEPLDFDTLVALCPQGTRVSVRQKLDESLRTGEEFDEELPLISAQGNLRWVRCRGIPEFNGQGYRMPSTWMVQDVSVYYELIDERRRTNDKLNHMVQERTEQLEEANRALTDFSHALSHDLKKPIRHMVSYAEILQLHLDAGELEQARAYCDRVRTAGARLHNLVEAMLKFSRLGRQAIAHAPVALAPLISGVVEDARASWPQRDIRVTGLGELPTVDGDAVLLQEVWANLVDNAIKYSSQCDTVDIGFGHAHDAEGTEVWIQDHGKGFDPSQLELMWQMFGRACDDPAITGDGIGLALVKQIVDSHGGRLSAQSAPGQGARFGVWLPRAS